MMPSELKRSLRLGGGDNSDQVLVPKGFLENEHACRWQNDQLSLAKHWECFLASAMIKVWSSSLYFDRSSAAFNRDTAGS